MGWFKDWRERRAARRAARREVRKTKAILEKRGLEVVVRPNGFIPDSVFSGGTLEENLKAAVWSFAAITANAEAVASLPPIVQRRGEGDNEPEWVRVARHPLHDFLRQPLGNKYSGAPRWSWQKLFEVTALQVELTGNAFWFPMDLAGGRRLAVQPFPRPNLMKADLDWRDYPTLFRYENRTYRPDELLNIQAAHPSSFWKGQSVYDAALRDITIDRTAHLRTEANLKNRMGASLVLKKEGWTGVTDEEKRRVLAWLKAEYLATNKDGMPLVIGNEYEVSDVPNQDHTSLIFETRKVSRDGIMAVTKVPPTILGIYENATLNNFNISRVIWWTNKLFPLAGQIYTDINMGLIWDRWGPDVRLWYDIAGTPIGLTVVKEAGETAAVLVEKLGYPTNAAAAHVNLGMPWFAELDKPNTNLTKAGREPAPDPDAEAVALAKGAAAAK